MRRRPPRANASQRTAKEMETDSAPPPRLSLDMQLSIQKGLVETNRGLVEPTMSLDDRLRRIESGETVVVGVNKWQQGAPSPLMTGAGDIMQSDPGAEADQLSRLDAWRSARDDAAGLPRATRLIRREEIRREAGLAVPPRDDAAVG